MKRIFSLLLSLSIAASGLLAISPAAQGATIRLGETEYLKFNRANGVTNIVGNGKGNGDIVLYRNVGTFSGVTIDAAIETRVNTAEATITDYDANGSAQTTGGYLDNFQINMNTTASTAVAGGTTEFTFSFFESGTYTAANTGIPVTLQNVKVTSIDLDSSGTNGFQFSDFTGFQKYQMMNPTNLSMTPLDNPARVRFQATKTGARSSVPEDQVLIKYDSMQTMKVIFGNVTQSTTNYYGLVFGGWPGTGTPVEYTNSFNVPPVSTDTSTNVPSGVATIIGKSTFGAYSDADNNPFNQVKIATLPSSGTLEFQSGSSWTNVSENQVVSITDIELGKLRFTGSSTTSFTFTVQDGLDYSSADNVATLAVSTNSQVITFPNPGARAPGSVTPAGESASSLLPVTLTSSTPGVCTIDSNNDIVAVATGTCVITATQSGNSTYGAAQPVTQTFPIDGRTAQTITFANPGDTTYSSTPISISPTSSSGLPVTVTSLTPEVCTVSSNGLSIVMVGTGQCKLRATQAGDGTRSAAPPVEISFMVNAGAPAVTTVAATSVASTSATLNGRVDAVGTTTTVTFCYSLAATVDGSGALQNCLPSGAVNATPNTFSTSGLTSVSHAASGLTTGTTYHFQVIATNATGTSYGSVLNFLATSVAKPTATTLAITANGNSSATLNGYVAANGAELTSVKFCYGKTSTSNAGVLSSCTQVNSASRPSGTSGQGSVTANVSSLSKRTTYYYQVFATSAQGTTYGQILKFWTGSTVATTNAASSIAASGATLNGFVDPSSNSSSTTISFCYSASSSNVFGVLSNCIQSPRATPGSITSSSQTSATAAITGLTENTTYYFQIIGRYSTSRTNYGDILSFTTSTIPPVAPIATTFAASSVLATTATLNGSVNANKSDTAIKFCYSDIGASTAGVLDACVNSSNLVNATPGSATGTSNVSVSAPVSSLTQGTSYYFQVQAVNAGGTTYGSILSFIAGSPIATTTSPTAITASSAILNGAVKTQGGTSDISFCYGTSNAATNGQMSSCTVAAGSPASTSASGATPSSAAISGLTAGQTYYFQVIGTKSFNSTSLITYGEILSFIAAEPPLATTASATSVTSSGANLNGVINSKGASTTAAFCYSKSVTTVDDLLNPCITIPTATQSPIFGSTTSNTNVSIGISDLSPGTTYYFQVIGDNRQGTVTGEVMSFTTAPATPSVVTDQPVVGASSATLNGSVIANGASSVNTFCYGTSSSTSSVSSPSTGSRLNSCLSTPASPSPTNGVVETDVASSVSGLTNGTTYYYQVISVNSIGTAYGAVVSFKAGAPGAVTKSATSIAATTATLNGDVSSNGDTASVKFCFSSDDTATVEGILDACSSSSNASPSSILGSNLSTVNATYNATGLTQGTTYYFQVYATNARGTSYGPILSFSPGGPTTNTVAASSVTSNSARLNGTINPNSVADTSAQFCLGTLAQTTGGSLDSCDVIEATPSAPTGGAAVSIATDVTGLLPSTRYFFQAIGDNANGTNYGAVLSFTTNAQAQATTGNANPVGSTSGTINGSATASLIDPFFCYGTSRPLTNFDPEICQLVLASGTSSAFTAALSALTNGATYYFQLFGIHDGILIQGAINSFTTNSVSTPAVTTDPATQVTKTSGQVNGTVNAQGNSTDVTFCVSTSSAQTGGAMDACFGSNPSASPLVADESPLTSNAASPVKKLLSSLPKGTKHYFQAVGTNAGGTTYGAIRELVTLGDPVATPTTNPSPTPTPSATKKKSNPKLTTPAVGVTPKPAVTPTPAATPEAIRITPEPKAVLPSPKPNTSTSPGNSSSVNTVDLGEGIKPAESTVSDDRSASERSLTELASEKLGGFAPGVGIRIDVIGARTTGQFVVAPGTSADPIAVAAALEESRDRTATDFAKIKKVSAVSKPDDDEIIGGTPTEDALDLFSSSDLAKPITVGDLELSPNSKWLKVEAEVDTYKPGSVVYLAVTTQPVIFGAALVDENGKANFSGFLPIDALESGGHSIRVVGVRELEGVSTDENGEVVLSDETMSEIQRFDEGTKSTVKIVGQNSSGGNNLVIREIPLLKIKPWWTVWLVLWTVLLVLLARRQRKLITKRERVIGQAIIGIATLPGLVLGWYTASYDIMGYAALLGALGVIAVILMPMKIERARQAS
jgi:hypothetical protein